MYMGISVLFVCWKIVTGKTVEIHTAIIPKTFPKHIHAIIPESTQTHTTRNLKTIRKLRSDTLKNQGWDMPILSWKQLVNFPGHCEWPCILGGHKLT